MAREELEGGGREKKGKLLGGRIISLPASCCFGGVSGHETEQECILGVVIVMSVTIIAVELLCVRVCVCAQNYKHYFPSAPQGGFSTSCESLSPLQMGTRMVG